jgi:energy-coupling factor transporter ATP-binding protein EcfA2
VLIAESPGSEETLAPLVRRAVDGLGLTVIWGTRPGSAAEQAADRILRMSDGKLSAAKQ